MKFTNVIQAVYFQPWSITSEGWRTIHSIVRPHLLSATPKIEAKINGDGSIDETTDIYGQPLPKMEITGDNVAIIPIQGPLLNHASLLDKQCGAVSYQDIKREVTEALDVGVSKIVFNVDSPGGMSQGSHELGSFIDKAAEFVRVEAVTDGNMCSAAYDICCGAHAIYCTPSAQVGSIGSMIAWLDQSVRYEMEGLSVEVFKSGDYKGAGTPGTSLTEKQKANFQSQVDKFAGMFKSRVQSHRIVSESTMQGQTFFGDDALEVALVDHILEDIEERFENLKN